MRPNEEVTLLEIPKPLLDHLVIRIPLMTGLSPAELADLQVADILWDYSALAVWRSKVSNDHLALVDTQTLFKIHQYLDKRKTGPLLQLEGSRPTKVQIMRRIVKKWARNAGLPRWRRVTPYTLRHTFAIKWILGRGTAEGLRRQLGHRSLQKLRPYLDFDYRHVREDYTRIFGDVNELIRRHHTMHLSLPLGVTYVI